jgi:site-specific recombinase XerD
MGRCDFAGYLTDYLARYLPGQRNLSPNTIASYRDTFRLLLAYLADARSLKAESLSMGDIGKETVLGFLAWLEDSRGCSVNTRNQRLCAIKAFVRFVQSEDLDHLLEYQRILAIKHKKSVSQPISYLSKEALAEVLLQPDTNSSKGRRDLVLLALLYDSGARVSELCDIKVRDVRLDEPATVSLHGKGRKIRIVPLMHNTRSLLEAYLSESRLLDDSGKLDTPLFMNSHGTRLSRSGVAAIVSRHVESARADSRVVIPDAITPHSFRHQKAVDLLDAGIALPYIRDLLGHRSVTTTEVYTRISAEKRRAILEKADSVTENIEYPDWREDGSLMEWLSGLCR